MLLCTATALMCLASGTEANADVAGAPYVQNALGTVFGSIGPVMITVAMILFAFTTLLGNLYYCDNALAYLNHKKAPSEKFMKGFYVVCSLVIFLGAMLSMDAAWAIADITMGGMALMNIPACAVLSGVCIKVLKDYEAKRKQGLDPTFSAKDVGLDTDEDITCW